MVSITTRRMTFREAFLAFTLGAVGTVFQFACGGGGGGGNSTPPAPASPSITSFVAAKSPITAGTSTTLTAVFTNGTGSVDKGVGSVSSGSAVTVSPASDTTYTLTVTNSAGVATTSTASVAVVAAPVATGLVAAVNPVPFGGATTVTPTFSGGTGSVDQGIGTVTSGTTFSSGAITATKTFTLTVTNAAGTSATTSVTLNGQSVAVGAVSPAAPTRTVGTSTTFSATVSGGATNAVAWTASAGAIVANTGVWTAPLTAGTATITATSVDDPTKSTSTVVTVVAAPNAPVITAPAYVTADRARYAASVPAQAGATYAWTVTNGTLTGGQGSPSIAFTAGSTGTVGFSCVVSNSLGTPSTAGTASSTIVAAPVATSLVAASNPVPYAGTTALTPTFSGGTGLVDLGIGTVTSGTSFSSAAITTPMTYTLTVTNLAGTTATAAVTLTPQAVSVGAISPALPIRTVGTTTTFSASVLGSGTGAIHWTASAGTMVANTGVWTAPITPQSVTITAASADDATKFSTTTASVIAAATTPTVTAPASVTANKAGYTATVPSQVGTTFSWAITNGTITSGTTGTSVTFTAGATGTVTLTCTPSNAAGTPSMAGTANSTIVAAPVATSLTAVSNPVPFAGTTTITPTFTGGTGSVDQLVGAVNSGTSFTSTAITASKTYTLTVTNALGDTATTTLTLTPATVSVGAISPANATRTGGTSTTFSATATGGGTNGLVWSANAGSMNPGTGAWTAPSPGAGTTQSVTITATSADDGSKSASTTVTVVPLPSTPVITAPALVGPSVGGYVASVPAQSAGSTYAWTITNANGTITSGAGTRSITFSTGASGTVDLSCVVSNATGAASSAGTFSCTITTAPVATVLLAATNPVPFGGSTTINPIFSGGNGVVDQAVGTVTNNTPFSSGAITASKTFTLTVTNNLLQTATTSVTVIPTPVNLVAVSPAVPTRTVSTTTTFSSSATGGLTNNLTWSVSGGGSINPSTGVFTAPASPATVIVTATSVDDPSKSVSTTVTVVAAPVATSLVASSTTPNYASTFTLTPTYTGGTGTIDNGVTCPATGNASAAINATWTGARTYTLTVTNTAGTSATATVVVTPKVVAITPISPVTPTRSVSTSTTFSATVSNGAANTLTWTASAGTMNPSTGAWTAPAAAGTVTITATSVDDPTKAVTTTATVVALPTTPVITAPSYVDTASSFAASVGAQVSGSTYAWTISNGTITGGSGTNSITFTATTVGTPLTLDCTVSNAAGAQAAAVTKTCTVVDLPSISQYFADTTTVAIGGAVSLSYTFTGTGVITPGNIAVTSGGSNVVHPTTTTTYTLTVTSPSGAVTTDALDVTVTPTVFNAVPAVITAGQGTLLTFTFTGTGSVDQGVGPVTSGSQIAVFPAVTTTYTLTATNGAGGTSTQTVTVTVKAFTGKFVYVANTGGGISGFSLDEAATDPNNALTELPNSPFDTGTATGGQVSIPALHVTSDPSGKFLYAVNGDGQTNFVNTVTAFTIDQATGDLTKVAAYSTGGNPWSAAVDPSGKFLYVHCDASISAFSINASTGALTPLSTPSVTAMGGSGELQIHPSGQYLFTVGHTSDQLQVFNLDAATGALTLNLSYALPAGTDPLSLALSYSGDYLFTKSEGNLDGTPQDCTIYGFYVDVQTGGLTPLASADTGLQQGDTFHGVSANPTQPVIYITLATSTTDYAAYALNLATGTLTPQPATTYDLFDDTGADNLTVSRNGKWGFITNFSRNQVGVGLVDATTGVLTSPAMVPVGVSPVSVCVVGTVQ